MGRPLSELLEKNGSAGLKVFPGGRSLPFETEIIEWYRRRESSGEEALVEMHHAGVSVRRVMSRWQGLSRTPVFFLHPSPRFCYGFSRLGGRKP